MDDVETKVPVKNEPNTSVSPPAPRGADPFEALRRKVDRLFDDFRWPPRRWGWPSGHGIDASITAFQVKYLLRVFLRQYRDPAQAVEELNAVLSAQNRGDEFVSLCVTVFDESAGTLRF